MKVLVVEDNPFAQVLLSELLEQTHGDSGLEVVRAATIRGALQRMRSGSIDVLVLDWLLQEGTCRPFLTRVRAVPPWRRLPALVVTPCMSGELRGLAELAPVTLLRKPIQAEYLLQALHEVRAEALA